MMELCTPQRKESTECRPPAKDDFKIVKEISRGAYGKVYLVKRVHERSGVEYYYAQKSMNKQLLKDKNVLHRVLEERQALSTIDCRFVVRIYFSFLTQDTIDFVMEYVEGGDIASLLIRHRTETNEPGLPEGHARFYIAEVLLALAYLHERGITHRDVKPENMLIDRTGHLKLTDFGFARIPVNYRQRSPTALVPSPNTGENKSRSPAARESLKQELRSPDQADAKVIANIVRSNCSIALSPDRVNLNTVRPVCLRHDLEIAPLDSQQKEEEIVFIPASDEICVEEEEPVLPSTSLARSISLPGAIPSEAFQNQLRDSRTVSSTSSTISDCTSIAGSFSMALLERPIQQLERLNVHDTVPPQLEHLHADCAPLVHATPCSVNVDFAIDCCRSVAADVSPCASTTQYSLACSKLTRQYPAKAKGVYHDQESRLCADLKHNFADRENVRITGADNENFALHAKRRPLAHSNRVHTNAALTQTSMASTRKCGLRNRNAIPPATPTGNCNPRPGRKRSVQDEHAENRSALRDVTKQKRLSISRFDDSWLQCDSVCGRGRAPATLSRALSLNLVSKSNELRLAKLKIDVDLDENDLSQQLLESTHMRPILNENARASFDLLDDAATIECARSSRPSQSSIDASSLSSWIDSNSNSLTTQSDAPFTTVSRKASIRRGSSIFGSASSLHVNFNESFEQRKLETNSPTSSIDNLPALFDLDQPLNPEFAKFRRQTRSEASHLNATDADKDTEQEQPRRDTVRMAVDTTTCGWMVSSSPLARDARHDTFCRRHSPVQLQLNSTAYHYPNFNNHLPIAHFSPFAKQCSDGFLHEPMHTFSRHMDSDVSGIATTQMRMHMHCDTNLIIEDAPHSEIDEQQVAFSVDHAPIANPTLDVTPPHVNLPEKSNNSLVCDANVSVCASGSESDADSTTTRCSERSRCLGTLPYMAPELWEPRAPRIADLPLVDMWALGVCLYEFLFGMLPFGCEHSTASSTHDEYGEIIEQIRNIETLDLENHASMLEVEVSKAAISAIRSLLRRTPTDRPTASQFREHDFFRGHIDFDHVHEMAAPWKPPINSRLDTQLFRENLERRGCAPSVAPDHTA